MTTITRPLGSGSDTKGMKYVEERYGSRFLMALVTDESSSDAARGTLGIAAPPTRRGCTKEGGLHGSKWAQPGSETLAEPESFRKMIMFCAYHHSTCSFSQSTGRSQSLTMNPRCRKSSTQ